MYIKIAINTIKKSIHNGESTHIQDQLITFANFNPINNIVNKVVNPIPNDLFSLIILKSYRKEFLPLYDNLYFMNKTIYYTLQRNFSQ